MKTATEIKNEIASSEQMRGALIEEAKQKGEDYLDYKPYKKQGKKCALLRDCLNYIEGGPREEFVQKELKRLQNKADLINKGYDDWLKNQPCDSKDYGAHKSRYASEMGLRTIQAQVKVLQYLLN